MSEEAKSPQERLGEFRAGRKRAGRKKSKSVLAMPTEEERTARERERGEWLDQAHDSIRLSLYLLGLLLCELDHAADLLGQPGDEHRVGRLPSSRWGRMSDSLQDMQMTVEGLVARLVTFDNPITTPMQKGGKL